MWAKTDFIHPPQRRFRTAITLTGQTVMQELITTQLREVTAWGCTPADYAQLVADFAKSPYKEGMKAQAKEQIHFGLPFFEVTISGEQKLAPEAAGQTAAYVFEEASR